MVSILNISKHIEKIMPLCMALFFARTVFIGYKYLFFIVLPLCVVTSVYLLFKRHQAIPKILSLVLPVLVMAMYFTHFFEYSMVLRETANMLLIVYFIFLDKAIFNEQARTVFFKWLIYLVEVAGIIAVLRFVLSAIDLKIPFSKLLFEGIGFALVNDTNFYSLFFIISIILSINLLQQGQLKPIVVLLINIISILNIVAGMSRRAYALYALLFASLFVLAVMRHSVFGKVLLYNVIPLMILAAIIIVEIAFTLGYYNPEMSYVQKSRYYKMYSLADNGMSYSEFDIKRQREYYDTKTSSDTSNLFFYGELNTYGLKVWNAYCSPDDCLRFELVGYDNADKVIRIVRGCSTGYYQVHYKGRPIIYHKDVTYRISFEYRVLEGSETPFYVGWSVNDGQGWRYNLPQTIVPIDSIWNRCTVSYKFKEDRMNPACFLNNLRAGSTIEVKNMRMTCDDTTGLPRYIDQLPDGVIHKYYSQDTINYFTSSRTDRWRYALELWQTRYNTKQKIFGQGFKYLEWYGEKFWNNPKRYDFPHNPIISSFLYSGIIGGVVYIIFLIMSLWLYWKKRRQLGIFFIMYLCCMFFSMFSGSSHFSFPLFAFLSFLPFVEYKSEVSAEKVKATQG